MAYETSRHGKEKGAMAWCAVMFGWSHSPFCLNLTSFRAWWLSLLSRRCLFWGTLWIPPKTLAMTPIWNSSRVCPLTHNYRDSLLLSWCTKAKLLSQNLSSLLHPPPPPWGHLRTSGCCLNYRITGQLSKQVPG